MLATVLAGRRAVYNIVQPKMLGHVERGPSEFRVMFAPKGSLGIALSVDDREEYPGRTTPVRVTELLAGGQGARSGMVSVGDQLVSVQGERVGTISRQRLMLLLGPGPSTRALTFRRAPRPEED